MDVQESAQNWPKPSKPTFSPKWCALKTRFWWLEVTFFQINQPFLENKIRDPYIVDPATPRIWDMFFLVGKIVYRTEESLKPPQLPKSDEDIEKERENER